MMRFLGVLVLIAAVVIGVGLYFEWFRFGTRTDDGQTHVTLTVDKDKIKSDEKKVIDKVRGVTP